MSLFTVDATLCKKDGLCAAVCPVRIIANNKQTQIPEPVENADELCINCGHCMAICPYGALSLTKMSPAQCRQIPKDWNLSPQQVELFLKARRSIRVYKKEPVSRDTIEKIIDVARYAPSGINRQPVHWLVVYDTKKVTELAKLVIDWMRILISEKASIAESLRMQNTVDAWDNGDDRILRKCPHVVIAYALKDDMTAMQAATISLAYLELAAVSFGLGACWAGYLQMAVNMCPAAMESLGINKKCSCFGAMMLGYPQHHYIRIPLRNTPSIKWK